MTITEESRYRLYKQLEETLGADDANTLMEHLPPVGWSDVATRVDIERLRATTKAELDQHQAANSADITQVRTEMAAEFTQVRTEIRHLEERMVLHVDTAIAKGLHRQFVQLIASTAAMFGIWSAIIVLLGR